uniref:Putative ribonuclease H-like domain-containing protein n=1 Tax=Tanacetum cinerariifolium TaxID=118510 RepID=A0A6L2N6B3_TANCI|nr:putative ribonuclease H-like domain-containing protein [Tanacetum cinerariifolium]
MADLGFAPQHNMIAYLEKTKNNAEFYQLVDFLTSISIHHSLTVSPTIYASNIEQFWNTATSQTINDEKQIHAIVDGKTVVIIESSEVILNGDSPTPTKIVDGVVQVIAPTTTKQRLAKKNELKERITLLMALPDKHQLKFNIHKDAKSLMKAIKKRFGGNKKTKKVQKTLLKQQYENFSGTSSKILDQIHDRLQKLISQLDILGKSISHEDINLKFLISLPSKWKTHTLIWRNKADLEEQSLDDLFKNLKIYKAKVKSSSPTSHNTQNIAFVSLNTDSTNELVSAVTSVFAASSKAQVSTLLNVDKFSDDVIYSFLEEMDIKWQMAILTMRAMRFLQRTRRNLGANGTTAIRFDMSKVKCYNCHRRCHFARECRSPMDKRNKDTPRRIIPVEASTYSVLVYQYDRVGSYNCSFQANEKPTNYALMAFTSSGSSSSSDDSVPTSQVHDRYKSGEGYHDVPPPYNGTFMPSKPDFVFHDALPASETVPNMKMVQKPVWNHAMRVNHQNSARMTHPYSNRHVVPTAVLTRSRLVSLNAVRPVTIVVLKSTVKSSRPVKHVVNKAHTPIRRHIDHRPASTNSNFNQKVTTVKVKKVNVVKGTKGNWVWKPKCTVLDHVSRLTSASTILKQFDYTDTLGRSKNPKGGKITGKGKIKTGKLDFDDVYFVKEHKFNLFSVSQMCDKKNSVLFTDTECVILSSDFKLPDENHVLLKVPRENNMYNVDLKNVVPSRDLTCLFAKATLDESNLWHRRLGHINFKTMNKLVKGNLVRGLPLKIFENNHTCVSCKKGKQHRSSCKSKPVSSVSYPLQRLYMDLFRPTFVKSLNKKSYSLVVTDDYSRFSWVFFLATKDETSTILKTFITGIKSQINHRVKIIRCDNRTEFKYHDLNQFCGMKGIKREFSVARTHQQNRVAERKNRALIDTARTILVDSLLPIPFWAEADEGFLVGYSVNSKAFRVFNSRTSIIQETLHINFLENQPNVAGSGPKWLFDINTLSQSMNYQPVVAGNQPNHSADPQNIDADAAFDIKENEIEVHVSPSSSDKPKKHDEYDKRKAKGKSPVYLSSGVKDLSDEFEEFSINTTNRFNVASRSDNVVSPKFEIGGKSSFVDPSQYLDDPDMPALEYIVYLDDEEDVGAEVDFSNLETNISVSPLPTTIVHKDLPVSQIIVASIEVIRLFLAYASFMGFMVYQMDVKSAFLYEIIDKEVYVCQPLGFEDPDYPDKVYKVVKALYGLHQAPRAWFETSANYLLENSFQRGKIDQILFIKKQKGDILLVQVYVDNIIFGSTNKELCKAFEKLMKDKFQMSSMGELTFFLGLQVKQNDDGIFISQDKYVA